MTFESGPITIPADNLLKSRLRVKFTENSATYEVYHSTKIHSDGVIEIICTITRNGTDNRSRIQSRQSSDHDRTEHLPGI